MLRWLACFIKRCHTQVTNESIADDANVGGEAGDSR